MNESGNAYSQFLQTYQWDYFATITFRQPRKDPLYNARLLWYWLGTDGGNDWGYNVDRGFFVSEPHTTGFLHYHGLLHERRNSEDSGTYNAKDYQRLLDKRFGRSDVTPIRSALEVAGYCCKYVVKAIDDPHVDYFFKGDWHH